MRRSLKHCTLKWSTSWAWCGCSLSWSACWTGRGAATGTQRERPVWCLHRRGGRGSWKSNIVREVAWIIYYKSAPNADRVEGVKITQNILDVINRCSQSARNSCVHVHVKLLARGCPDMWSMAMICKVNKLRKLYKIFTNTNSYSNTDFARHRIRIQIFGDLDLWSITWGDLDLWSRSFVHFEMIFVFDLDPKKNFMSSWSLI